MCTYLEILVSFILEGRIPRAEIYRQSFQKPLLYRLTNETKPVTANYYRLDVNYLSPHHSKRRAFESRNVGWFLTIERSRLPELSCMQPWFCKGIILDRTHSSSRQNNRLSNRSWFFERSLLAHIWWRTSCWFLVRIQANCTVVQWREREREREIVDLSCDIFCCSVFRSHFPCIDRS